MSTRAHDEPHRDLRMQTALYLLLILNMIANVKGNRILTCTYNQNSNQKLINKDLNLIILLQIYSPYYLERILSYLKIIRLFETAISKEFILLKPLILLCENCDQTKCT